MAFSYDPTTDTGMVRLLIADTDGDTAVFSDAEIAELWADAVTLDADNPLVTNAIGYFRQALGWTDEAVAALLEQCKSDI